MIETEGKESNNRQTKDTNTPPPVNEISWYGDLSEANVERDKFWDSDGQISLSFRGNELAGEVGEACNIIKKLERKRLGMKGSRATVDQLADELADVVIAADLVAMECGINLNEKVAEKFNKTSDKYGLPVKMKRNDSAEG